MKIFFIIVTKNVKNIIFVIKFQMVLSRIIKIYYIKNDNYRLIFKHYSMLKPNGNAFILSIQYLFESNGFKSYFINFI